MITSTEKSDRQQYDRCGLLVGPLFSRSVPARGAGHCFPEATALSESGPAARGLSCGGGAARSQPPEGSWTAVAAGGCTWTAKFLTASWAAASAVASRTAAT